MLGNLQTLNVEFTHPDQQSTASMTDIKVATKAHRTLHWSADAEGI